MEPNQTYKLLHGKGNPKQNEGTPRRDTEAEECKQPLEAGETKE